MASANGFRNALPDQFQRSDAVSGATASATWIFSQTGQPRGKPVAATKNPARRPARA
jgi:hypothetical protein